MNKLILKKNRIMKNILIVAFLFSSTFTYAQDKTKDKEKKKKTIEDLTKSSKKIDGLFTKCPPGAVWAYW